MKEACEADLTTSHGKKFYRKKDLIELLLFDFPYRPWRNNHCRKDLVVYRKGL